MCGIAGGYWGAKCPFPAVKFSSALATMRERGPDHQGQDLHVVLGGVAALGHTRLSIIDLSAAAVQPMHSPSGRYSLVFNGEILNYLELQNELSALGRSFSTRSDTEVLLAAWEEWGERAIPRFKGMFAFAVLDRVLNTLTLVRDAFGIKPLFYTHERDTFLFASDIRALQKLKSEKATLNWQKAYDYLVHGEYDVGEACFIDGAYSLKPGCLLRTNLSGSAASKVVRWWTPSIVLNDKISFRDAAQMLRERFLENVALHLRSDVPVGAALSGGIDSSAIVCAIRHVAPDAAINTFSYIARDSEVSEEAWVDRVNRHVGAIPHKAVVTGDDLIRDLDDLIVTQGEPFGSTSIYAQYRVYKLAREHGVTVTLDGQGADEMMGGYNGYPGLRMQSFLDSGDVGRAWSFLCEWAEWPGRSRIEGLKRLAGVYAAGGVHDLLRRLNGMSGTPDWIRAGPLIEAGVHLGYPEPQLEQSCRGRRMMAFLAYSLTERGLPGLLRHGDRNSMRFSVESRVPFLTTDLAEFMLSLPEEYLVSTTGETKTLLRAAMRGIVPDDVLDRRDKIGFATPERTWLLEMAGTIRKWLAEDVRLSFLDQAKLCTAFDQVVSGRRPYTWQVWRWINFVRWYKGLQ